MKIGVLVALAFGAADPEFLEALGPALEERGLESLWVPEHVVLFDSHKSTYPYSPDGTLPIPADAGLLDPFVALTYLAARTTTLRLGTGVCLVGQRNPVYTAKQVADLDVLSRGRVEFGIGLGWLREEYEAAGMPWERRGARVDEHLDVIKSLWTEPVSSHEGSLYALPECRMYPKPVQTPHPAIHVGGESDAALRRAARRAQGWFGMYLGPDQVSGVRERLARELAAVGRGPDELSISVGSPGTALDRDTVSRYRDAGVERLIIPIAAQRPDDLYPVLDAVAAHTR